MVKIGLISSDDSVKTESQHLPHTEGIACPRAIIYLGNPL
jgi:hypothetical protein